MGSKPQPIHESVALTTSLRRLVVFILLFSVTACRTKWGTLRDYFFKKYRESKTTKSGQAASKKRKWHLFDAMSFLIPYYCSRETGGNLVYGDLLQDDNLDIEETGSQPSPAPPPSDDSLPQETFKKPQQQRKRKSDGSTAAEFNNEILKALKEPEALDEHELFFKSLLPSMRKLSDIQAMEFRIEVQSLLLKYLKQPNRPQNVAAAEPSTSSNMGAQHFGPDPRFTPMLPRVGFNEFYPMTSFSSLQQQTDD